MSNVYIILNVCLFLASLALALRSGDGFIRSRDGVDQVYWAYSMVFWFSVAGFNLWQAGPRLDIYLGL